MTDTVYTRYTIAVLRRLLDAFPGLDVTVTERPGELTLCVSGADIEPALTAITGDDLAAGGDVAVAAIDAAVARLEARLVVAGAISVASTRELGLSSEKG